MLAGIGDWISEDPVSLDHLSRAVGWAETNIRAETGKELPPNLKSRVSPTKSPSQAFQDADSDELKVLDDMLAVYRAGDPIVADIRRAALVLRKRERSTPTPKVTARRNR